MQRLTATLGPRDMYQDIIIRRWPAVEQKPILYQLDGPLALRGTQHEPFNQRVDNIQLYLHLKRVSHACHTPHNYLLGSHTFRSAELRTTAASAEEKSLQKAVCPQAMDSSVYLSLTFACVAPTQLRWHVVYAITVLQPSLQTKRLVKEKNPCTQLN